MVQPTTFFGLRSLKSHFKNVRPATAVDEDFKPAAVEAVTGCTGTTITPTCLSHLYSFSGATAYTQGRMGIAGFLEQWPSQTDLTTFLGSFASEGNAPHAYTCTLINGGLCPTSGTGFPGVEANLDVQYAAAITEKIPNVFYSTGGSPPIVAGTGANTNEPYLEFLDALLALPAASLPNTLSISYGDDERTVPNSYATETCSLFSQLGARGVSILVSSGDSGVGTTCDDGGVRGFTTSYPASCPFVTVVGGTTGNSPEAAWTDGGGGFSNVFGRPSYQNTAVTNWLATDTTHTAVDAFFNSSGRAYPDVAAQATNFEIVVSGRAELVDGTSCASPTFASIIQLVNSDRISKGKAGLGFLNPWLYSTATTGMTDIKTGKITGCSGVITGAGFSAVTGWDPATGLGTPIFTTLLAISNTT
jgi:tripeptidyl-peptidase-1